MALTRTITSLSSLRAARSHSPHEQLAAHAFNPP
jgi:hypothetical protein